MFRPVLFIWDLWRHSMERLDEHSYLIMQVISTSGFVFRIGNVTSISIVVVFVVARCVCPRSAGGSAAEAEGSGHAACRLSLPFPVAVAPRTLLTLFRTLRLWVTLITNYSPWVQLWYCKLKVYIYPTWICRVLLHVYILIWKTYWHV